MTLHTVVFPGQQGHNSRPTSIHDQLFDQQRELQPMSIRSLSDPLRLRHFKAGKEIAGKAELTFDLLQSLLGLGKNDVLLCSHCFP